MCPSSSTFLCFERHVFVEPPLPVFVNDFYDGLGQVSFRDFSFEKCYL